MEQHKFSISGSTVTFTTKKEEYTGEVIKSESGYDVKILTGPDDEKKRTALARRMKDWYYFTQVKK